MKHGDWGKRVGLFLGLVLLASGARAVDMTAPPWRGLSGTTFQEWDFNTPSPFPETSMNPYGVPIVQVLGGSGTFWAPGTSPYDGTWYGFTAMTFGVPNKPDLGPWKDLHLQITYDDPAGIFDLGMVQIPGFTYLGGTSTPLDGTWWHTSMDWVVAPNPPSETVSIYGLDNPSFGVTEVDIDTWCHDIPVPEASTFALFGLGAVGLLLGRRRKAA